jgi:Pyruvate/2-oxoacid:ferredoxin oxidoreductase gamma subunit
MHRDIHVPVDFVVLMSSMEIERSLFDLIVYDRTRFRKQNEKEEVRKKEEKEEKEERRKKKEKEKEMKRNKPF